MRHQAARSVSVSETTRPSLNRMIALRARGERMIVRDEHDRRLRFAIERLEQLDDVRAGVAVEIPSGSSAKRMRGEFANARAIATRCCSPPESCVGK